MSAKVILLAATIPVMFPLETVAQSGPYEVITISGGSSNGSSDGIGSAARFNEPLGLCLDAGETIYVADTINCTIRKLTPAGTNWVTGTIAGLPGYDGPGEGTNGAIRFNFPSSVTLGRGGNLYVADTYDSTIRELTPIGTDWVSKTIVGLAGSPGNVDGTNSDARFNHPYGVAADSLGDLYVADAGNNAIRKLCHYGTNWVSRTISAGSDPSSALSGPRGVALDSLGNVYVADTRNGLVRMLTQAGTNWILSTMAGFNFPTGVAVDRVGNVYVAASFDGAICKISRVGSNWVSCTLAAGLYVPSGVSVDSSGYLYEVDLGNGGAIRKLVPSGTNWVLNTIAGLAGQTGHDDGTNAGIEFDVPFGVSVDSARNVYVTDTRNSTIRELSLKGTNWVSGTIAGLAGHSGSADGTNEDSRFSQPMGVAVSATSNIFVADTYNSTIRELTMVGTNWVASTIAGSPGLSGSVDGVGSEARFGLPMGIAVGNTTDVYVADSQNNVIRKVTLVGTKWVSSTIAGLASHAGSDDGTNGAIRFNIPSAITVSIAGNLYVADAFNSTIRELVHVGTNWVSATIAGLAGSGGNADGTNSDVRLLNPRGVATDGAGNVYVADTGNNVIRRLVHLGSNWVSSIVAGQIAWPYSSDDGPNSDPRFNQPLGIAVDNATNLYVADGYNSTIREVLPLPIAPVLPVFQRITETNGLIYLIWSASVGQSYQLQVNSDLTSSNWNNLGPVLVATSGNLWSIDSVGPYRQRFYRILMLP